jgi:hypothetical protein
METQEHLFLMLLLLAALPSGCYGRRSLQQRGARKVALWVAGLIVPLCMASATGHHWDTHEILNLIIFVGLG